MVDGQVNKPKVLFIIQARMKSTRLPGKVLMTIPFVKGQPLLSWIVNALKRSKFKNKIVIATSKNKENEVLKEFAFNSCVDCFFGEEEDVLSRFIQISKVNESDVIVRVTADNPFMDIELLDDLIEKHFDKKLDYSKSIGLPIGMNFEVFSPHSLLDLDLKSLSKEDKEHVTLYIRNNSNNQNIVNFGNDNLEKLRLTIDYPNDFVVASTLLSFFDKNENIGIVKIIEIHNQFPWLFETNQTNFQKQQFSSKKEELQAAIKVLELLEFNDSLTILKKIK